MLRARQYTKLYHKYHTLKLSQSQAEYDALWRVHTKLLDIRIEQNWRRYYAEKSMPKMW